MQCYFVMLLQVMVYREADYLACVSDGEDGGGEEG